MCNTSKNVRAGQYLNEIIVLEHYPNSGEVRDNYLQPLPDCRDHGDAKMVTARNMKLYRYDMD